jgi:hypothetical protein
MRWVRVSLEGRGSACLEPLFDVERKGAVMEMGGVHVLPRPPPPLAPVLSRAVPTWMNYAKTAES